MRESVIDMGSRPIRNQVPHPKGPTVSNWTFAQNTGLGAVGVVSTEVDTDGTTFRRVTRPAEDTANTWRYFFVPLDRAIELAPAGAKITVLLRVRCSNLLANGLGVQLSAGNTIPTIGSASTAPVIANAWTWVRCEITLNAQVSTNSVGIYIMLGTSSFTPPSTFDISHAMLVPGTYTGDYCDGGTPGWRWLGTPGSSESVGYPYTLESIAGSPMQSAPAETVQAPITIPLPALSGRSAYVVYDVVDTSANFPTVLNAWGTAGGFADGRMSLQHAGTGSSQTNMRFDGSGPDAVINQTRGASGARTPGRHVAALTMADGLTSMTLDVDGSIAGSRVDLVPGTGFISSAPTISLGVGGAFALLYSREHDLSTRRRITAWLARQYGAPIPSGY